MDIARTLREAFGEKLRVNDSLAAHTTFRIGGSADFLVIAKTVNELVRAISIAREHHMPFEMLGGGSNMLVSDKGFRGLIIKPYSIVIERDGDVLIADAGTPTALLVNRATSFGLGGFEFLSGIPGTIGGAIVANAHAFFLGDFLDHPTVIRERVVSLDILTPENTRNTVHPKRYQWHLNGSSVKESGDIILRAQFKSTGPITQKGREYLKAYAEFRGDKPYTLYPSAGSVFRNIPLRDDDIIPKGIPEDIVRARSAIPAGWLVEQCGFLGTQIGGAKVWDKHGNIIVNVGQAKAQDVYQLIRQIQKAVREKFNLDLESEIRFVGEFN